MLGVRGEGPRRRFRVYSSLSSHRSDLRHIYPQLAAFFLPISRSFLHLLAPLYIPTFLQPVDKIMAQNQHTERSWWAADNESMRPYYGRPHKFQVQMLKDRDNRPVNSCYLLRDRQTQPSPTSSRLDAIQNSNPPPRTRTELFERAGATFFQHCKLESRADLREIARLISI